MAGLSGREPSLIKDISIQTLNGKILEVGKDGNIAEFKYIEDMNLGFPIVELLIPELALKNLNAGLQGHEIIKINKLIYPEPTKNDGGWEPFSITNSEFRVKSIGVGTPTINKFGNTNFIQLIAHHIDQERLQNFDKSVFSGNIKDISELVSLTYDAANISLAKIIEKTEPLPQEGFWNLYIPYSSDPMKVIRKFAHLARSSSGTGAYLYYHNRKEMHFETMKRVMDHKFPNKEIRIFEGANDYIIRSIRLAPFNDMNANSMGHVRSVLGYNYKNKEMHRQDWDSNELTYEMTDPILPIYNPNSKKCIRPYYTPFDDPKWMKSFAETLYVSQSFNEYLEIEFDTNYIKEGFSNNFSIGDVIPINFLNSTPKQEKYANMSGWWLIKTNGIKITDYNVTQSLRLVKAGIMKPQGGPYTKA